MDNDLENLDTLLRDIYEYLKQRKNKKALSTDDRKIAEKLIDRSKKQLQKISVITSKDNNESYYDFVVPKNENYFKTSIQDNQERQESDFPPPLPVKNTALVSQNPPDIECPFKNLSASEVSHELKFGTLLMRRKVFGFIDRWFSVYGAVHQNWFLIYWSIKHSKPLCAFNLKQYEAKENESDLTMTEVDDMKNAGSRRRSVKSTLSFMVFQSASFDKKYYSFVATTHADMMQWVVSLNRSHDNAIRADKGIKDEIYEKCEEPPEDLKEEAIYMDIDTDSVAKPSGPKSNVQQCKKSPPPPPLPAKQTLSLPSGSIGSILPANEISTSPPLPSESAERIYQVVSSEEDQKYFELCTVRKEVKDQQNNNCNVDKPTQPCPEYMNISEPTLDERDKCNLTMTEETTNKTESKMLKADQTNCSCPPKDSSSTDNGSIVTKDSACKETFKRQSKTGTLPKETQSSSIIRIFRRFSSSESPPCKLNTFTKNTNLETFQASTIENPVLPDFDLLTSPTEEIENSLKPIVPPKPKKPKRSKKRNEDEKLRYF